MRKTLIILTSLILLGCMGIPTAKALDIDKEQHLTAGIVLGTFDWKLGCIAGAAKEIYDSRGNGTTEFADFALTCGGSGLTHVIGDDRSLLYRANVSAILLDGVSTSHFVHHSDAVEVGPVAVDFMGERPSDEKIAAYTVLRLGVLRWSEEWPDPLKYAFQIVGLLATSEAVIVNFNF